jgi:two-component system response regulator DesR
VIRTLLAMPGGLLRGALRFVLSTQDDMRVVAEHDNVDDALSQVREHSPDVTVLDLDLLGVDPTGSDKAFEEMAQGRLLVLIDPRRPGLFQNRLNASPANVGVLAQTVPPERVVDGIRRLHQAEPVVDSEVVIAALGSRSPLTPQEVRVLHAAAAGAPIKEIARMMGLSPGTVRNHLSRIIAKTGGRTRIEAIHIARQSGWL